MRRGTAVQSGYLRRIGDLTKLPCPGALPFAQEADAQHYLRVLGVDQCS